MPSTELRRLSRLSSVTRRLWTEPAERQQAVADIVAAIRADKVEDEDGPAVRRVDEAITEGLQAIDLPRGFVTSVTITSERADLNGIKYPDCRLQLSSDYVEFGW